MLYPTIITVNVSSIFFQIYNIGVENKHSLFLPLDLRTLMCHLTEMKHIIKHFYI